ncbi:MAG: hypothetical protein ABIH26_08715, partial [Candidatus Eisenbacteria bacterium]
MITWEPSGGPGADRYVVYRDGDSIGVVGGETAPLTLRDSVVAPNEWHGYAVRGGNADGLSPPCEDLGQRLTAPGPPVSFEASRDRCGTIRLEWEAPLDGGPVWGYRIVRSTPPGGSFDLSGDLRSYEDAPGIDEVVYTLRAFNCEESTAREDTGRFVSSVPPPPASCAAGFETCSSLRVSWTPVGEAKSGYVVLRGAGTLVDSVGPSDTSAVAGNLGAGTGYVFRVFSVNDCGRSASACSAAARIPGPIGPPPAGSCSASRDSCRGVEISWTWAPEDAEWYRVFRTDNGTLVGLFDAGVRRAFDATVEQGDTAYYSIRAGNRCFAAADSCRTWGIRPGPPSAPEQCSASTDRCGLIRLSWFWPTEYINQNIQGFRIYRRRADQPSAPWDTFTVPPRIGAVTWDDANVELLASYIYRIAAYARCGEASGGCQVTGSANTAPAAGLLLSPANGASGLQLPVRLTWQSRARATSYRLEIALDAGFTETIVDTSLAGTAHDLRSVDTLGTFHWRVRARNACGDSPLYPARTFSIPSVSGLAVVSGSSSFSFGNGVDTLFADSTLVLENRWTGYLAWIIQDTLPWIEFRPLTGSLAPGQRESVTVSVGDHRCGVTYADTVFLETNPVPPGHGPIGLAVSLVSEARPGGDVDWDCALGVNDVVRILDALLGEGLASAAESTGADANGDTKLNVADAVLVGRRLLEAAPAGEEKGGFFDLQFRAGEDRNLEVSAGFPLRAVLFFFGAGGGDLSLVTAVEPERTVLRLDPAGSGGAVLWFSDAKEGNGKAGLLRVGQGAGAEPLEA